jgi:hypothetical protein
MDQQKFAEQIFNGSLAILAVLIAVAGILSAEYAKPSVSGNQDVAPAYQLALWAIAGLSLLACAVSFIALARIAGRQVWTWLLVGAPCFLLIGATAASVGIVIITLFY